ncbi:MAG: hypothetical protein J1F37_03040 [Oscillospiraceae bacterium]|nr:hypothetical protein [Oscillospiraceae bacterium]
MGSSPVTPTIEKASVAFAADAFFIVSRDMGLEPARVSALMKQSSGLFLAESARRVLKFAEFRSPKRSVCKALAAADGQVPSLQPNKHQSYDTIGI